MKKCSECGIEKSKSAFNKNGYGRDGLRSRCKGCDRVYRITNANRILEMKRIHNRLFYQANVDEIKKQTATYRRNNLWLYNADTRKRQAGRATPPWLTPADLLEIVEWYRAAKDYQWLSNEQLQVDHIIPLKSPIVCGLHVPWNLQVLSRSENRKKTNKLKEVMQ